MRTSRLTAHCTHFSIALARCTAPLVRAWRPPVRAHRDVISARLFASGGKSDDMDLSGLHSLPEFTESVATAGSAAATTSAAVADDVDGGDRELAFSIFAKELDDLAERDLQPPDLSQYDPERVAEMDAMARKLADRFLGVVSAGGESADAAPRMSVGASAKKRTVAVMNAENMHRHELFESGGGGNTANGSDEARVLENDVDERDDRASARDQVASVARETENEKTLHDALDNLRGRRRSVRSVRFFLFHIARDGMMF